MKAAWAEGTCGVEGMRAWRSRNVRGRLYFGERDHSGRGDAGTSRVRGRGPDRGGGAARGRLGEPEVSRGGSVGVDLETTGGSPEGGGITEIAAVRVRGAGAGGWGSRRGAGGGGAPGGGARGDGARGG